MKHGLSCDGGAIFSRCALFSSYLSKFFFFTYFFYLPVLPHWFSSIRVYSGSAPSTRASSHLLLRDRTRVAYIRRRRLKLGPYPTLFINFFSAPAQAQPRVAARLEHVVRYHTILTQILSDIGTFKKAHTFPYILTAK